MVVGRHDVGQVCFPFKGLALQLFRESNRCPSESDHLASNRCAIASREQINAWISKVTLANPKEVASVINWRGRVCWQLILTSSSNGNGLNQCDVRINNLLWNVQYTMSNRQKANSWCTSNYTLRIATEYSISIICLPCIEQILSLIIATSSATQ